MILNKTFYTLINFIQQKQIDYDKNEYYKFVQKLNEHESNDIINEFISKSISYLQYNNDSELVKITSDLYDFCISGNKKNDYLEFLFGTVFPFVCEILFDGNDSLNEVKRILLELLKFFIKTDLFDGYFVNDLFLERLFELLQHQELFISISTLLECIFERSELSFDLTKIKSLSNTLKSISYLHLGVFLPVIMYLIHDNNGTEVIKRNIELLNNHNIFIKILHLLSLSNTNLSIIYLLQNDCIEQNNHLIQHFKYNYEREIECYPEIEIQFDGIQGIYSMDVISNILFVYSLFIHSYTHKNDIINALENTQINEVLIYLYDCIDLESISIDGNINHIQYRLFSQLMHLISLIPINDYMKEEGVELLDMIISDIEEEIIDKKIKILLLKIFEMKIRDLNDEEKEIIGIERKMIKYLIEMIEENDEEMKRLIYDCLASLIKYNEKNMNLMIKLIGRIEIFIDKCINNIIESNVLIRSILLNIKENKLSKKKKIEKIMMKKMNKIMDNLMINIIGKELNSNTICSLNTIIVINGIYKEIIQKELNDNYDKMKIIISLFTKRYSNEKEIEELSLLTNISKSIWLNGIIF